MFWGKKHRKQNTVKENTYMGKERAAWGKKAGIKNYIKNNVALGKYRWWKMCPLGPLREKETVHKTTNKTTYNVFCGTNNK